MPTSRQQLEACLTKLRAAGLTPPKAASTQDGFALHIAVWLERIARYDPRAVATACERWISDAATWPLPAQLIPMIEAEQAKLEQRAGIASHSNRTGERSKKPSTPEEISHTAKLVFDIEASPESFACGRALAKLGRSLIYRHIANGTCPPDVATFFPPEGAPTP